MAAQPGKKMVEPAHPRGQGHAGDGPTVTAKQDKEGLPHGTPRTGHPLAAVVLGAATLFVLQFFRDPERTPEGDTKTPRLRSSIV